MRMNIASTLLIVASLGLGTAVLASPAPVMQNDTGFIYSIDLKDGQVTLMDQNTYNLPPGFDLNAFSVGDKVSINYQPIGTNYLVASQMTLS